MGTSQALVLEQFLEGKGFAKKPSALLAGIGAKLHRASELASSERRALATGMDPLDRLLTGGLPKGALIELSGRRSSGRFSIGIAALAAATSSGQAAALVDLEGHLDPQSANAAGVDLERLFWVRPTRVKEALAAAEMLLAAGFSLVVADFGLSPRGGRFVPDGAWVRLARSTQAQGSSLLLLTPDRISGIAAEAVVSADGARAIWQGSGRTPRLLVGISSQLTLEKFGRATPGRRASLSLFVTEARAITESSAPAPPSVFNRRVSLNQAGDARESIKARIKTHDPEDAVALHQGQVKRVSGGQPRFSQHDSFGALNVGQLDRKDLVRDLQKRIEGGLNGVAPANRDVAVKDFLEDLRVGH